MFFALIDINISIQLKQMRRSVREKHFHSIENNRALATSRAGDSAEMPEPMACPLLRVAHRIDPLAPSFPLDGKSTPQATNAATHEGKHLIDIGTPK